MSDTENPTGADTPDKPTCTLKADLTRLKVKTAAESLHLVTKKLIELCVESSKVIDLCVEGDKLLEAGAGAAYRKAIKGVCEGLASPASPDIPFVPSRRSTERKRQAEAQQTSAHRSSRANGKGKGKVQAIGVWDSSEEEEEEEEEEDDDDDEHDDVDSDGQAVHPISRGPQLRASHSGVGSGASSTRPGPSQLGHGQTSQQGSQLKQSRNLPQIRSDQSSLGRGEEYHVLHRPTSRPMHRDSTQRTHHGDGPHIRAQPRYTQPDAARQTLWSRLLDPGLSGSALPRDQPVHDTLVQMGPGETITKAFASKCLLSAGDRDKEYRSAKSQGELAIGDSLINVLNEHPPPQTGLLDAVRAHERDRKREGGIGVALTEREREKRLIEDRQKRFDDLQRQQLDQVQQGGSIGQFGHNLMTNPMMMGMNPMMGMHPMMGMNPMMAGVGMNSMMVGAGMPPLNPMMNDQMGYPDMFNSHLMLVAQQAAAQAYQETMMAFSVAGSQVGGEGEGLRGGSQVNANMAGFQGMNPGMGGGMGGYDPRMPLVFPMIGVMGLGMSGQMGGQMPIGMQTTGISAFDPIFPPGRANPSNGPPQPQGYGTPSACGAPRRPV